MEVRRGKANPIKSINPTILHALQTYNSSVRRPPDPPARRGAVQDDTVGRRPSRLDLTPSSPRAPRPPLPSPPPTSHLPPPEATGYKETTHPQTDSLPALSRPFSRTGSVVDDLPQLFSTAPERDHHLSSRTTSKTQHHHHPATYHCCHLLHRIAPRRLTTFLPSHALEMF
jgi:hypothetical protein